MRARLNIRQIRVLIWIACVGLLLHDGWTFYRIFEKKKANGYQPRSGEYFQQVLRRDVPESGEEAEVAPAVSDEFDALWKALVSGEDPDPPAPVAAPAEAAAAPTKVVLKDIESVIDIQLVFYSTEPHSRFIALVYKEDGGKAPSDGKLLRLHVSEGEPLRPPYDAPPYSAKVLSIEPQAVTFQWGDSEVEVHPQLGNAGTGTPYKYFEIPGELDVLADRDAPPARSEEIEPGVWIIGTLDRKDIAEDPDRLVESVRVRTVRPKQDERTSLEIVEVEEGSLVQKYGGMPGDRIISVNDYPMTSLSSAMAWFKMHGNEPAYHVVYERQGAVKTLVVHNP